MRETVHDAARRARAAARILGCLTTTVKNRALHAAADAVLAHTHQILAANAVDLEAARAAGTPEAMLDRLALNPARVDVSAFKKLTSQQPPIQPRLIIPRIGPNSLRASARRSKMIVAEILLSGVEQSA